MHGAVCRQRESEMGTYDAWKADDTSPVDVPEFESDSDVAPAPKRKLRVITNSELRTARRCSREHYLAYVRGIRPVAEAEPLIDGSAIHAGLAAWWLAQGELDPLGVALNELERLELDAHKHARLAVMLTGYHERWALHRQHYEVLAVEKEFRAPLINPETGKRSRTFDLGGKVDVLAKDRRTGLLVLIEHKTTSEDIGPGSTYWKRLLLDSQISIYYDGARALGFPVDECVYDVLGKPQQRPSQVPLTDDNGNKIVLDASGERVRTANGRWRETASKADGYTLQTRLETPEEYAARMMEAVMTDPDKYYQRGVVVRTGEEMVEARFDTWQQSRLVAESETLARHPRNPDSCMRYSRPCDYFGVCTGTESTDDPALFIHVDHPHQELSEVA